MFFRKKKSEIRPVPTEEVERMLSSGMGDKEIIRSLKSRGYSYNSIERAMLHAVKQGVGEERPVPSHMPNANTPGNMPVNVQRSAAPQTLPSQRHGFSTLEEVYGATSEDKEEPVDMELPKELIPSQNYQPLDNVTAPREIPEEFEEDMPKPEILVEELVEGVVEEKWQKFNQRLEKLEDEFENIKTGERRLGEKIEATERESPHTREVEGRIVDMSSRLEELEVRIGGLEKAFRQFLPSLTSNIENLSEIIHQMKKKQGFQNEL